MVETTDEWITTRTGIRERRIVGPGESCVDLAADASRKALEAAGVRASELDLIVCATASPDQPLPSTAAFLQVRLGAANAAGFDLAAACSGFLYGLSVADQYVRAGQARRVLVVGAEALSRFVDFTDRETCVIFGDGAGAAVIAPVAPPRGVLRTRLGLNGAYAGHLHVPAGGSREPADEATVRGGRHFIKMKGNELFKVAVKTLEEVSQAILEDAGVSAAEVALYVPHQANERITAAVADRLGFPRERILSNIDRIGNTSSASIPIGLDEAARSGRLSAGDLVLMAAFGAGVTWAAALARW
jgi:3-oxoacyl-[acyl-carrier-protein] synthase-3